MSKQLLTAYELVGGYGKIDILHGVSLSVGVGEIVSVIGPNGAGKSTAFKTIVGFLRPRSGRVVFNGEEITGIRPDVVIQPDRAYALELGRNRFEGPGTALLADPEVKRLYLGG